MTCASVPLSTATALFVAPRSIPKSIVNRMRLLLSGVHEPHGDLVVRLLWPSDNYLTHLYHHATVVNARLDGFEHLLTRQTWKRLVRENLQSQTGVARGIRRG